MSRAGQDDGKTFHTAARKNYWRGDGAANLLFAAMRKFQTAPPLLLQAFNDSAVVQNQLRQEFECDFAPQVFIARQPDDAHPTPAENPHKRVTAEELLAGSETANSLA